MKLIYRDIYETINESMSDSQIGSRKGMNIRNHVWVLNSIICDTLSRKGNKPIDIHIYDYKQCFDCLWLEECLNDMYEGGLDDDKLNLLYTANQTVNIAVRTPVGKTEVGTIHKVVIQGDVFGPMLCSKQVDTFGKECLEEQKYNYLYKGKVAIPPLSMVDDVVCISECGYKAVMSNSYMQSKTRSKKLQFGSSKCKKIHIGKQHEDFKCHNVYVDSWEETETTNTETGNTQVEDICIGEEIMEEKDEEKYLGDVISKDGRNLKNIKARINKGKGIVKKILNILEGIPVGKLYYQVAVILRNSLLVSSIICNSEAWFSLTESDLNLLETVDVSLLRSILKAPKSTPKEMLFMELGLVPLRDIIRERRLNFLFYILSQEADSMVFNVFQSQCENRTKRDWVTTVINDMEVLGLNVTFSEIQAMTKIKWKNIVKNRIKENSLKYLENMKQKYSKVMDLKHMNLTIQKYFLPTVQEISEEEIQMIFKMRSQVTKLKMNMKSAYDSYECKVCEKDDETQQHVYECKEIWKIKGKNIENIPQYEKIKNGSVSEQVEVARIFKENLNVHENFKYKEELKSQEEPCDRCDVLSAVLYSTEWK